MGSEVTARVRFDVITVTAAMTRAANTTAYADGDAISDASDEHYTFEIDKKKISGAILGARLHSSANQSTKLDAELFLFREDIADQTDNAAFDPSDAEMLTLVGHIPFLEADWVAGDDTSGADGNAFCDGDITDITFTTGFDTTNSRAYLYGQLKAKNAYTPVSGEVLTIDLIVARD